MREMTVFELKEMLEKNEQVSVVDIRLTPDFNDWFIVGSRNIPVYTELKMGEFANAANQFQSLPSDRPVVAVCYRGNSSKIAVDVMERMSIPAINLIGGMTAWSAVWTTARIPVDNASHAICYQVRRNAKGCLSYFLAVNGEAAVIDPSVDESAYLEIAREHSSKIVAVIETHIHADHISRARSLAESTGASLCLLENQRVTFPYSHLKDGDAIAIGGAPLRIYATPGHTGESACYSWFDNLLFTGDTIFVESVGRPDLEKGDAGAERGAKMLYESLHKRLMKLPPRLVVCPGHTSEMIGFDKKPIVARLAELIETIEYLRQDEKSFVQNMVSSVPAKPPNFQFIISINEGRADFAPTDPLIIEAGPNRCAVGK
jgi:glyoxylase-like metal-dependent hydrolase (beta-lactamase superfamily II)/rhodanese-related sulfurtransferase